jgi:arginine/serine-rich splicing factor 4/5/6
MISLTNILSLYRIVEFANRDDMLYALRKYDDTKLNGQRIALEEAVSEISQEKGIAIE